MLPPLRFEPILKSIRWGGTRLGTVLGKPIGERTDCAESWEISDHGADQSIVASGPLEGWTLARVVAERGRALLGRYFEKNKQQFPLLVKFLDAHDRLSVQVHPNDAQAARFDPTENGKSEAWVIVEAEVGSRLFAGLKSGVNADELQRRLEDNTLEECLHSFEVSPGDCVFIPAGTVHAIGEGILLAEVQQSSDLTFRLYDWGRGGADGKPRDLHIAEALQCTDFTQGPVDPVTPELLPDGGERLVESAYFRLTRYRSPCQTTLVSDENCHVLIGLAGTTTLEVGGHCETLETGQTVLVPAECPDTHLALSEGAVVIEAMPV